MSAAVILFASVAFAAQSPTPLTTRPSNQPACGRVSADALTDVAVGEICAGDDAARLANAASADASAKRRAWQSAAEHYRRASTLSPKPSTKIVALNALANVYDATRLNDFNQLELTLRELIALTQDDLSPVYRLAKVQEDHELIDAAEDTLLGARHQQPDAVEPYMALGAFYLRRANARRRATDPQVTRQAATPQGGVVRVGGVVAPPVKLSDTKPRYPAEALAAGVQGVVIIEVTINESGNVTDARILRSIPLLDAAALEAVRQFQFAPSLVNGQAVPVVMTTTVNFTLPPSSSPPRR